jgi:hypothetical protein
MSLKGFLPSKVSRGTREPMSTTIDQPHSPDVPVAHRRRVSERVTSAIKRALRGQHRRDSVITDSNAPPSTSLPSSPASSACHTTQLYRFESPIATQQPEIAPSSDPSSPPATADSEPAPLSSVDTPTTSVSETFEYEKALTGLREAEKILEQRHTVLRPQPEPAKKSLPPQAPRTKKPCPNGVARLPAHLSRPSYQPRQQEEPTANEACNALQRRKLVRDLAYRAAGGCHHAMTAMQELNNHYVLKGRGDAKDVPDLILDFEGIHISASELRTSERTWVSRFNAVEKIQAMTARKHLGQDDSEQLLAQLFPAHRADTLKPESLGIFLTGLKIEGIITPGEAKYLADLGVTLEEFEAGARWTGPSPKPRLRRDPSSLAIFDIPQQLAHHAFPAHPTHQQPSRIDLYPHLRTLAEAAVYSQSFYKGYFFANPRSKLTDFHRANISSPSPHLADYVRPWTYRETRLLARSHLITTLLTAWDNGEISDFGLIRIIRGTYVPLPGQAYFPLEDMSSFLYHRVPGSGLAISCIPEILALHPEHDAAFANPQSRGEVMKGLDDQAKEFEEEEQQRLLDIEVGVWTFNTLRKKEMGRWRRVKVKFAKWMGGKGEAVQTAFDPFAEEYMG